MPKLIYESWAGTRHVMEATEEQARHLLQSGYHRLFDPEKDGEDAAPAPAPPPFPEPPPATREQKATES